MNEMKLKPCPFCGGEAVVLLCSPDWMVKEHRNRFVSVVCKKCASNTALVNANNHTGSPLRNNANLQRAANKAADLWNKRVKE